MGCDEPSHLIILQVDGTSSDGLAVSPSTTNVRGIGLARIGPFIIGQQVIFWSFKHSPFCRNCFAESSPTGSTVGLMGMSLLDDAKVHFVPPYYYQRGE